MLNQGWQEQMKEKTRCLVEQSGGASEITLDELSTELTKHGKASVPGQVSEDILERIRQETTEKEY
jgi:hypothetical protein